MFGIRINRESAPRKHRWRQFSLRGLILLVFVFAVLFWWLQPEKLDRSYFPIGIGYKWIYTSTGGNTEGDVVFEVLGKQQVGDSDYEISIEAQKSLD